MHMHGLTFCLMEDIIDNKMQIAENSVAVFYLLANYIAYFCLVSPVCNTTDQLILPHACIWVIIRRAKTLSTHYKTMHALVYIFVRNNYNYTAIIMLPYNKLIMPTKYVYMHLSPYYSF